MNLEETLKDRCEVVAWSWRDFWSIAHPFLDQDIDVVFAGNKACVIIATVCYVTRTVYRIRMLQYTFKKRRFWRGWKIKYDGHKIHNMFEGEPLIAEKEI